MRETNNPKLGKCPKCGQSTPLRSGSCLYCGALLDEVRPIAQPSSDKLLEEPRQLGTGPRFQKTYDGRGHYLFLGAREPIAMEPNKLFVIGRDAHSSLVVHSQEISRHHCEIDWRGEPPRPVLVEVRARNGTFVNDRPLRRGEPEPIRDRDVIRLGRDFEVVYRQLDERELKETLGDNGRAETRAIKLPAAAPPIPQPQAPPPSPLPVPGPLPAPSPYPVPYPAPTVAAPAAASAHLLPDTGDLSQVPGGLLLELLHRERRSGVLTIFDGQTAGEVRLAEGRAQVVVFGALQSRDALDAIARATRGVYRFVPEQPAIPAPPLAPSPLAAMAGLGLSPLAPLAAPASPPPGIPAELFAAYQAQLGGAAPQPPPPPEPSRAVPPELAALFAAASGGAPPPAYPPPQPQAPPPPAGPQLPIRPAVGAPTTSSGHVAPLRGASEPTPEQIAAVLGNVTTPRPSGPPRANDPHRPPTQQVRHDPHRPPTQQVRNDPHRPPTQQVRQPPGSTTGSRSRSDALPKGGERPRPAEPLRAPTDPYSAFKQPTPSAPAKTAPYAAPSSGPSNGDSPEAREANALLATVRAVGISGEALGNFVGDTMGKLLEEGKISIALELAERGLELADKGSFESALATRVAFKATVKNPLLLARALELVEKAASAQGAAYAARAAQRTLKLVDPEVPPSPRDGSVLGKLAAIAQR